MFDPAQIPDEACVEGHLDRDPIYEVLLALWRGKVTGRLTTEDAAGPNHMYFMQGRPVGVHLAEFVHPLGQLLLELGRVNGQTFVKAQRLIAEGGRLAGQVFKELGVLDDDALKQVLQVQARKKAEHFCRLGSRPFQFCRGLTFLTGFNATPLDIHVVIYLAVRQQLGPDARAVWIEQARDQQVRIQNAAGDELGLPAPLSAFGFGVAEERFLQRIVGGWEKVADLVDTSTLPPDEAAVLLRFLEVLGRLDRRAALAVPAHISALIDKPSAVALRDPTGEDVFSSSSPSLPDLAELEAAAARATPSLPDFGGDTLPERTVDDGAAALDFAGATPELQPLPAVAAAPPPESVFAGPLERTDPRRPSIHEERTQPSGAVETPPAAALQAPRFKSVLFPEQNAPPPPSVVVSEDVAPVVKKKKVKRTQPLPSEGSGVMVSETRKEKTQVGPMPTIVIEEEG